MHNGRAARRARRDAHQSAPVNIIILDDYQDAVRKLKCASILEHLNTKVFTNTVKGIGQLSVRVRDAEVLVLIRERTQFPRQLLEKLPKLKLISQTGKVGSHIDVETCTRLGIAVAEGVGSPVAPAELDLGPDHGRDAPAAAVHRHAQARRLAAVGAEGGVDAAQLRHRHGAEGQDARHLGLRQDRPARRRLRQGVRHAGARLGQRSEPRARARRAGYEAAESQEAFFERSRRAVAAPAPERRDARHRQARRALAHEADGAARQHLARRADRGRRARLGAQPRPARHGRGRRLRGRADPAGHLLLRLENAICTPHIGYVEQDSYELYFRAAFENVVNFIEGQPTNIVNPEALKVRH